MTIVDWLIDSFASADIIDLYFIMSDLKELLPFSSAESAAHAIGNAAGTYQFRAQHNGKRYDLTKTADVAEIAETFGVAVGKLVL